MDRFTDEQIQEYHECFCMYDKNNKGSIRTERLSDVLLILGINATDRSVQRMILYCDRNEDGRLRFDEFLNIISGLLTEKQENKEGRTIL